MNQKLNINKKSLFEIKSRIEKMKTHHNVTQEDRAYMEAISEAYFKFSPGNQVAFEFGFIEGYFKALHTYVPEENQKKIITDVSKTNPES